jgi:hypothetical protein
MELVQTTRSRFFDGDLGPGSELKIDLERVTTPDGAEEWAMLRRLGYSVRHLNGSDDVELIVPAKAIQNPAPPAKRFTTDLTSVPQLFTWLVPKSGTHLPAALLHDGLVSDGQKEHDGPDLTRVQADRVFREAMADLGTPVLRRWIIWTAVTLASVRSLPSKLLQLVMYAGLLAVGVLGYLATLDLFDQIDVLPWMGNRPWNRELLYGLAAALVIPLVTSLPWALARLYRAGWIASWSIAVLFHVSIAVAAVSVGYQLSEWSVQIATRQHPRVRPGLALAGLAAMVGLTVLTLWLCRRNP